MEPTFSLKDYQMAYREIVKKEARQGFIVHLIAYLVINPGLIILNLLVIPDYIWFYWPLLGWGLGLIMHYLFAVRMLNRDLEQKEALSEKKAMEKTETKKEGI